MAELTQRKQNIADLDVLLNDLARKVMSGPNSSIGPCVKDLSDSEIATLVDKVAWVIEWLGWS